MFKKTLNLKQAWEFIIDEVVIQCQTDYYVLCHIAKLVNEDFYSYGYRICGIPVIIVITSYIPSMPIETFVIENIQKILSDEGDYVLKAIKLCLYCMKTQIFNNGNKRAAVIFANHYLISYCSGMLVIPEKEVRISKDYSWHITKIEIKTRSWSL